MNLRVVLEILAMFIISGGITAAGIYGMFRFNKARKRRPYERAWLIFGSSLFGLTLGLICLLYTLVSLERQL